MSKFWVIILNTRGNIHSKWWTFHSWYNDNELLENFGKQFWKIPPPPPPPAINIWIIFQPHPTIPAPPPINIWKIFKIFQFCWVDFCQLPLSRTCAIFFKDGQGSLRFQRILKRYFCESSARTCNKSSPLGKQFNKFLPSEAYHAFLLHALKP